MSGSPRWRRCATLFVLGVAVCACGGKRAQIPDRVPEPVAPVMTPAPPRGGAPTVSMPQTVVHAPESLHDRLRYFADSVVAAPMWRNARWGIAIVDAAAADTLYLHDADRLFMPASNQKLLTSAVALQQLGGSYRWRTPVVLAGSQRGSTFTGNLVVIGSGDPSVSDSLRGGRASNAFAPVVDALRARGITRIDGSIVAGGDAFPGSTTGYGWEIEDLEGTYGAPVDELFFNEGELTVRVRANPVSVTESGATRPSPRIGAATITTYPTRDYPVVVNRTEVRAAGIPTAGAGIIAAYDSTGHVLVVSGSIAPGDSVSMLVPYRHPTDALLAALRQTLGDAKIAVVAPRVARDSVTSKETDTLVVLESPPLAEILPRMQKPSQNQIAELLFRTTGRAVSGDGSADSARAVATRTLASFGVSTADAAYRDGSGMSRHDYVTPRAILRVLEIMRQSPEFDLFRTALPLAGVDGTLRNRMRSTPAERNAYAKTGTVDKARSLSGYVTTADGHLVMFSMLANNFTVSSREVERVQDAIVSMLAGGIVGDARKASRP